MKATSDMPNSHDNTFCVPFEAYSRVGTESELEGEDISEMRCNGNSD